MNSTMCLAGILIFSLIAVAGCQTAELTRGEVARVVERGVAFRSVTIGGIEHKYSVYVPREYNPATPMPAIIFLNGSGECGMDGTKQLTQGLIPAVFTDSKAWPFVVICPQKPESKSQWIDHDELVMAALKRSRDEWNLDGSRIYLTGLSQGGAGTWEIGAKHPEVFAAIAPICGYGEPTVQLGNALKTMPIWAFHGGKDDVVPPAKTAALVAAVRNAGGTPGYTVFPDANHNSWDAAYRTQKLGDWFLSHHK